MPYSPLFGDHFYSRDDGRAECAHVFINGNGLTERFAQAGRFHIGETGFGTGLNFTETWRQWKQLAPAGSRLCFTSFEKYPMRADQMAKALTHWPEINAEAADLVAAWPKAHGDDIAIDFGPVRLEIKVGEAITRLAAWQNKANAWFLDGFAPARNPDMWSQELMTEIAAHSQSNGTIATYTVAGWVRRNLASAGYTVEKRPGFAGKRDMSVGWLGEGPAG